MLELRGQHSLLHRREDSLQCLGLPTVHFHKSFAGPGDHRHEYHYSLQGILVGKQCNGEAPDIQVFSAPDNLEDSTAAEEVPRALSICGSTRR